MTDTTTAEKRRVLQVFRVGLLLVAIGTGAVLWLPERTLGSVPIGVLGLGLGLLVLVGAGYVGLRREFGSLR